MMAFSLLQILKIEKLKGVYIKVAEKNLKARIVHKHDTEANWLLATGFTPKQGELIVYDVDETHSYERFKIGDGVQNVNDLPFYNDGFVSYNAQELGAEQKAQARTNIGAVGYEWHNFGTFYVANIPGADSIKDFDSNYETLQTFLSDVHNVMYVTSWTNINLYYEKILEFIPILVESGNITTPCKFMYTIDPNSVSEYHYCFVNRLAALNRLVLRPDTSNANRIAQYQDGEIILNTIFTDATLTQEAIPADAKVVGEALALKADQTALDEVSAKVGKTSVTDQITDAIENTKHVLYTEQELTDEQKAQARANIGVPIQTIKLVDNKVRPWEYEAGAYVFEASTTGNISILRKEGVGEDAVEVQAVITMYPSIFVDIKRWTLPKYDRWSVSFSDGVGFRTVNIIHTISTDTWESSLIPFLPNPGATVNPIGKTLRVQDDLKYVLSDTVWSVNGQIGDVTITADDIGAATQEYVNSLVGDATVTDQITDALAESVADWDQTDETAVDYIKNKPEIATTDEVIDMMIEKDMILAVRDGDGAVLSDENGKILLW